MTGARTVADALECGPIWVSPHEVCELRVGGEPVPTSIARLRILARLIEAGGRIVPREDLYRASMGDRLKTGSRAVDIHVTRLRHALGPFGRHIVAVTGRGYRLNVAALEAGSGRASG